MLCRTFLAESAENMTPNIGGHSQHIPGGQVERVNKIIKEATVTRYYYAFPEYMRRAHAGKRSWMPTISLGD
jgi:hypothetical protein